MKKTALLIAVIFVSLVFFPTVHDTVSQDEGMFISAGLSPPTYDKTDITRVDFYFNTEPDGSGDEYYRYWESANWDEVHTVSSEWHVVAIQVSGRVSNSIADDNPLANTRVAGTVQDPDMFSHWSSNDYDGFLWTDEDYGDIGSDGWYWKYAWNFDLDVEALEVDIVDTDNVFQLSEIGTWSVAMQLQVYV